MRDPIQIQPEIQPEIRTEIQAESLRSQPKPKPEPEPSPGNPAQPRKPSLGARRVRGDPAPSTAGPWGPRGGGPCRTPREKRKNHMSHDWERSLGNSLQVTRRSSRIQSASYRAYASRMTPGSIWKVPRKSLVIKWAS